MQDLTIILSSLAVLLLSISGLFLTLRVNRINKKLNNVLLQSLLNRGGINSNSTRIGNIECDKLTDIANEALNDDQCK